MNGACLLNNGSVKPNGSVLAVILENPTPQLLVVHGAFPSCQIGVLAHVPAQCRPRLERILVMPVVALLQDRPVNLFWRGPIPIKTTPLPPRQFLRAPTQFPHDLVGIRAFFQLRNPEIPSPSRLIQAVFPCDELIVKRIVPRQFHRQGLESPTGSHDIPKPRHRVRLCEHGVEAFEPHNGSTKDDLRDDQQWYHDVNDLGRLKDGRNQEPQHIAKQGHREKHQGVFEGESWDVQDEVRHGHKSHGVNHGHKGYHGQLGMHVMPPIQLEKPLAFQQASVAQNFLCTDTEPKKQRHNHRYEQKGWNVLACAERVHVAWFGEPHECRKQKRQSWGFQCVDKQILSVAELGEDVPVQVSPPLGKPFGDIGLGLQWFDPLHCWRKHIAKHDRVKVIPLLGGGSSRWGFTSVFIDRLGLDNVKELFRIDVATCIAFTLVRMNAACQGIEVPDGLQWISPIDGVTTGIQHEQPVEHLEQI